MRPGNIFRLFFKVNEDGEKEFVDMSEEPVELGEMKPKRYIKKVPKRLKPFQLLYQTDADEDKYSMSLPKGILISRLWCEPINIARCEI